MKKKRTTYVFMMLSISAAAAASSCSALSSSLFRFRRNPGSRISNPKVYKTFACFTSTGEPNPQESQEHHAVRTNYGGVRFEDSADRGSEKLRLDSWISSRIQGVSRARIQSSIRAGLVSVNGRTIDKVAYIIKAGDKVNCTISELQPLKAEPEDIPLDIVYEDAHVLVVNKPAHMVVHPAPGNANGTLVNGLLYHCRLPTVALPCSDIYFESADSSDDELDSFSACQSSGEEISSSMCGASVRPGIVHRLDKGTSGLLVVAKDEHSHAHLSEQFKLHTIHRVYISLTSGVPSPSSGRIEIPIARDANNRIRMAAVSGSNNCRWARHAASTG